MDKNLKLYKCTHCNCSSLVYSSSIVENQQTVEHKIFAPPYFSALFKVNFLNCISIFFSEWIFFVMYYLVELPTEAGCESEHSLLLLVLLFTLTGLEPPELVRGRLCWPPPRPPPVLEVEWRPI